MKFHDLIAKKLLGETVPPQFTSIDGRLLLKIDSVRLTDNAVNLMIGNEPLSEVGMTVGSISEALKAGNLLQLNIDGLFLEVKLS